MPNFLVLLASEDTIVVSGAILAGLSVLSVWIFSVYFSDAAKQRRQLHKAPTLTIANFPRQQVGKIAGKARRKEKILTAPLSGRPCLFYTVTVHETVTYGKNTTSRERIRDVHGVAFYVEDETGRAVVNPLDAVMFVEQDTSLRSGTFNDATPALEEYLARFGMKSTGPLGFNLTLRYVEGIIEEGEAVRVLGYGMHDTDHERASGYRDTATLLVLQGTPDQPLLISDEPA